jgi:hypothetical protein
MKTKYAPFYIALLTLFLASLACSGSFSSANIAEAWMATDPDGENRVDIFAQDEVFYAMVDLQNAPDDTKLKAVWTAVEVEDTEPNLVINETETTSSDALLHFQLENESLWPVGKYKVEIYLNDELSVTLNFEVR